MGVRALLLASGVGLFGCGGTGPQGPSGPEEIFLPAEAFAPLTAAESLTTIAISGVNVTVWSLPQSNGQPGGVRAVVVVPASSTGKRPTVSGTVYTPSAGRVIQPFCINYLPHDAVIPDQSGRCVVASNGGGSDSITAAAGSIETATAPVGVPETGNISPGDVYVVRFENSNGNNAAGTIFLLGVSITFP